MRRRMLAAPLVLAFALAGCAAAEPEPSEAPSVSPSPSASETASQTPTPVPTAEPVAEPVQCGDAYVLASNETSTTSVTGTDEAVLATLAPRAEFLAPGALEGLDVLCTVTTTSPADGSPTVVDVSIAFLAPDPGTDGSLATWAAANDYVSNGGDQYSEHFAPTAADGSTTSKIVWMPLTNLGWDEAQATAQSELLGVDVPLDGRIVVFYDFTTAQG